MSINWFDVVFVVVLVGFTLLSTMRGALKEGLSLIGLGFGYWAALSFHEEAGSALEPIVRDEQLAGVLAFVLILGAGFLLGTFLGGATDSMYQRPRGAGSTAIAAALGLAKGLIVCLAMIWLVEAYLPPFQVELDGSGVAPYLGRVFGWIEGMAL